VHRGSDEESVRRPRGATAVGRLEADVLGSVVLDAAGANSNTLVNVAHSGIVMMDAKTERIRR
jgi:hypothetical protein